MIKEFVFFGIIGWIMEILWTGFNSLLNKDARLTSTTSIWMFFIYGSASFLMPVSRLLSGFPVIIRGGIYVVCFFAAEYLAGFALNKFSACPWDYSGAKYNIHGIIRLDYAPLWFTAGLFFEYIHMNGVLPF